MRSNFAMFVQYVQLSAINPCTAAAKKEQPNVRVRGARREGCDVSQLARIDVILTFELSAEGEVGKPMSMAATATELPFFFVCVGVDTRQALPLSA